MKVHCWPCQLKVNCFCHSLLKDLEKKAFARSVASYQVLGDVFICWRNETTSDTAAANGICSWFGLRQSTLILQNRSVFCTGQICELNGEVLGITTLVYLMALIITLISATPPAMQCCFSFTIFLGRGVAST